MTRVFAVPAAYCTVGEQYGLQVQHAEQQANVRKTTCVERTTCKMVAENLEVLKYSAHGLVATVCGRPCSVDFGARRRARTLC